MKPRVLIVEDEPGIADTLQYALRTEGFEPAWCSTGEAALLDARQHPPALVILDVGLPDASGFEIFKRLRAVSDVPVVFLTARSDEIDRVVGLELGADDYVAKPFSPRELVLRVQSVLRRSVAESVPEGPVTVGDFALDSAAHEVRLNGEALSLTAREFDLLAYLIWRPHKVLSREDLLRSVWGWEFGDLSTVTVHVRRLREKIEADSAHPRLLNTVWGVGYRFDPVPLGSQDAPPPAGVS